MEPNQKREIQGTEKVTGATPTGQGKRGKKASQAEDRQAAGKGKTGKPEPAKVVRSPENGIEKDAKALKAYMKAKIKKFSAEMAAQRALNQPEKGGIKTPQEAVMADTKTPKKNRPRKLGTEEVIEAAAKEEEVKKPEVVIDPKAHLPAVVDKITALVVAMPDLDPYLNIPKGLPFEEWEKAADQFKAARNRIEGGEAVVSAFNDSLMFRLGDFLNHGQAMADAGAEGYVDKVAQYLDGPATYGYSAETVRKACWVCDKIPKEERYREPLTFKHHVIVASMSPEDRKRWLDRALAENLSANALRLLVRTAKGKKNGKVEGDAGEPPEAPIVEVEPLEFSKEDVDAAAEVIYDLYDMLTDISAAREKDSEADIDYEDLEMKTRAVNGVLGRILLGIDEEKADIEVAEKAEA